MFCCAATTDESFADVSSQPYSKADLEQQKDETETPYLEGPDFQARLGEAFKLSLPFEGVNLNTHDFDKDTISLESEGITNAKKIAAILKEDSAVCVRVLGYTEKGDDSAKCVRLSLGRTRAVRTILEAEGCMNKVAAKGLGFYDDKGPRCELAVCTAEEADVLEAEALELEMKAKAAKPVQERLEEAFKLPLPFESVTITEYDSNKDTVSLTSEGITNAKKIAAILREDATVCVRVLGYTEKGDDSAKCDRVSLDRSRAVRKILEAEGCVNKVAAKGNGYADDKGPRCELALCTAQEADALEAEALALERQAKAKSKAIPPGPRTIEVQAMRNGRDSYGLQFDCQDPKLPVIKILQVGGIMDAWNSSVPLEKKVAVGMGLIAVDGKAPGNDMVKILNMPGNWSMTFKVPKEFTVTLRKGGTAMGLDVRKCNENGAALLVAAATGQAADAGVKSMDRIQEVNGQAGVPDELIKLLTSAEGEVTLKIHSFAD